MMIVITLLTIKANQILSTTPSFRYLTPYIGVLAVVKRYNDIHVKTCGTDDISYGTDAIHKGTDVITCVVDVKTYSTDVTMAPI